MERIGLLVQRNILTMLWSSPVLWARFGLLTEIMGRSIPINKKPLLIISLPRSGSSWVGSVFARCPEALYLREPLTQSRVLFGCDISVFPVAKDMVPRLYRCVAQHAFKGIPAFPGGIIPDRTSWKFRKRFGKRVVIKEVNPMALEWLLDEFRPRVILLVRHPAAVACSYHKLGWTRGALYQPVVEENLLEDETGVDFWTRHGVFQALSLSRAHNAVKDYEDAMTVRFEDLCTNPISIYRELCDFAGLTWDGHVASFVEESSAGRNTSTSTDDPYSVFRDSQTVSASWKHELADQELTRLKNAYLRFCLPFYDESSW